MFLKHKPSGDLVEVLDADALFDPCKPEVLGRFHVGEEMPDPGVFNKSDLIFPSGEKLPRCWLDAHYRNTTP